MSRSLLSKRNLSLVAVCLQSSVLAIVLHFCQESTTFRASSAVLLTELIKFILSSILAINEIRLEINHLKEPVFKLPSPELYGKADELHRNSELYSEDPYDLPTPTPDFGIRRRSSSRDLDLGIQFEDCPIYTHSKSNQSLSKFAFPSSPLLEEVFERAGVVKSPLQNVIVYPRLWPTLWSDVKGEGYLKMFLPAVLFAVQNNLIYVAARNLSVPVFQITFQIKTVITAVAAVLILKRSLSYTQWLSLIILSAGVATIQIGSIHAKANDSHSHTPLTVAHESNSMTGLSAVLISVICSSIASTYFEYIIKKRKVEDGFEYQGPRGSKPASLWIRNVQLSFFSLILGTIVVLVHSNPEQLAFWVSGLGGGGGDGMIGDPLEHWYEPFQKSVNGFFDGFAPIVYVVILLQSVGGLLIAIALKYADNVSKGFAVSVSIVFTFLLSIILFDFQVTFTFALGAIGVIVSTFLYEVDEKRLLAVFGRRSSIEIQSRPKKIFKTWYLLVPCLCISIISFVPGRHHSLPTAAWQLVTKNLENGNDGITLAVADMSSINSLLEIAAQDDCKWGVRNHRESSQSAFGNSIHQKRFTPYSLRNTDQYSLDDILVTRVKLQRSPLFSKPAPDFILLPILSQIWSKPWDCPDEVQLSQGITQTTTFIRQLAASIGQTSSYPRIILPIAGIRSNLESELFTPEIMEELNQKVIIVGIEGALKNYGEGMKYVIDVPYPTRNHLAASVAKGEKEIDAAHYYFHRKRPYLLHYAGAKSHPWNPTPDSFNGFELRAALHSQLSNHLLSNNSVSRIIYDEILESHDGSQDLEKFSEHMAMSKFCLAPPGDSPTRRSFYEAIQLGCIPVIFRQYSYGRLFPSSPDFLASKFSIYIDENDITVDTNFENSLVARLESISRKDISDLQYNIRSLSASTIWAVPTQALYFPLTGNSMREIPIPEGGELFDKGDYEYINRGRTARQDAFKMLLKELSAIKEGKWESRNEIKDTRAGITVKKFGGWRAGTELGISESAVPTYDKF